MKKNLYAGMALNNIKKNYRFFIPRILSEAGLTGCFYIALTLAMDKRLSEVKGGAYIPTFMWLGVTALAILSVILLLYINSFLMKQRRREFGLYNILGLEKKHVKKVLFHESAVSCLISEVAGLLFGILFYKLSSLLICKLLKTEIIVGLYYIKVRTLLPAGIFFISVDLLAYIVNCIEISKMKPVDLLISKAAGEKEPKVKWVMLILGILCLAGGYTISIVTKSPLAAMGLFFVAVILVIAGTYFLFVTGSTFVLKLLKKNERFYYNKNHMTAISGLLYRMKQNAVGLASIAILATGILVMVSSTVSLYSGMQGTINKNYPQHMYFTASLSSEGKKTDISKEKLEEIVREASEKNGIKVKSVENTPYLEVSYYLEGNRLYSEPEIPENFKARNISTFYFITEKTYKNLTGEKLNLKGRETATCRISSSVSDIRELTGTVIIHGNEYKVKNVLSSFPIAFPMISNIFSVYGIVVSDDEVLSEIYEGQKASYGSDCSEFTDRLALTFENISEAREVGKKIETDIYDGLEKYSRTLENCDGYNASIDSYWDAMESVLGMYGTLLFLGILLGTVCLFATVLIMYYKQISEGYEDRERFQIMKKIGMSKEEIRKTVNFQVLLVFFLPLATSGIHLAFAFPIVSRLLRILSLYKTSLLLECTLITFCIFTIVYVLIYKGTSRTYYKIVH